MDHILEIYTTEDGDSETRTFKTLAGAVGAGLRELKKIHRREFYGYQKADRRIGEYPQGRRHVVAEWKDHGKVLGIVWV